ncbi:hypothetical protein niasHT_020473 [Heterodera trifolii]
MVEAQQLIELIFCILLPPVAILLHGGLDILHLILNIVLCILGYVPGIIHALCIVPYTKWKPPHYSSNHIAFS